MIFRLEVTGIEKLPSEGAFILCPNHQSYLDPPVLLSTLPWKVYKRLFILGTSELFNQGMLRRIAQTVQLFCVDSEAQTLPALRIGCHGLRQGKALLLYPEGGISEDGVPKRFKVGAAVLASRAKVPIFPVALDGFHDAWPKDRGLRKLAKLTINVGDAVWLRNPESDREIDYEEITARLFHEFNTIWSELQQRRFTALEQIQPNKGVS